MFILLLTAISVRFPSLSPRPCVFGSLPLPLLVLFSPSPLVSSLHIQIVPFCGSPLLLRHFPFFPPLSPLSGRLLSPQSPTLHCLFVSLYSSPSVLIPSVFPHSYLSHFSPPASPFPLPLPSLFQSPKFISHPYYWSTPHLDRLSG